MKTRKIRLKTNHKQKKKLFEWMNTARYVYNQTVQAVRKGDEAYFMPLRDKLVTRKGNEETLAAWQFETPKEIRAYAVKDYCTAVKTAWANLKNGNIKGFNIGFKKKKKGQSAICIQKQSLFLKDDTLEIYPKILGKELCSFKLGKRTLKRDKKLEFDHDCRLVYERGYFWLAVPVSNDYQNKNLNKEQEKNIKDKYCGIDPGNRVFATVFDESQITEMKIEESKLRQLKNKIKTLVWLKKSERSKYKARNKLQYLVDDMHIKTANYLTNKYEYIFMGQLDSQKCQMKSKNKTLNEELDIMKHYQFRMRLRNVCLRKKRKLFIVNEAYTTMSCTNCGNLNRSIGAAKEVRCFNCDFHTGRDVSGSRNILLKGIVQNQR